VRLDDIISQLQSQITRYTESFNDISEVESAEIDAGLMKITLTDDTVPDTVVNVRGIKSKLLATDVEEVDTGWKITFAENHDQTYSEEEINYGIEKTVDFIGDFEAECKLVEVPSKDSIIIESSIEPTGTFNLLEARYGYSGRLAVTFTDLDFLSYPTQ